MQVEADTLSLTVIFDSIVNVRPATWNTGANKAVKLGKIGLWRRCTLSRMTVNREHSEDVSSCHLKDRMCSHTMAKACCNASVHHHPLRIISMAASKRQLTTAVVKFSQLGSELCVKPVRIKLHPTGLMGYFNLHKNIWTLVVLWKRLIIESVFAWDLAAKTGCESLGAKHTFEAHTCQLWVGDNGMESQQLKVIHVICFVNGAAGREYNTLPSCSL